MAQKRKQKTDNRPWVDKDDIVIYDGTKESINKIHTKAKKLGGSVGSVVYSPIIERMMEFDLHPSSSERDFYTVTYKSAVVFTESQILWYATEKVALEAVRVRTGFTRVTIIFEQDDKINEIVVPRTYSPFATVFEEDDDSYDDGLVFRSGRQHMKVDLGMLVEDDSGITHYMVDRVKNPDTVIPQFNEKLVIPNEQA